MGRKRNTNNNSYSSLSAAEFKGKIGEKVEHIEEELVELKKQNCSNAMLLQGLTTNLAVLMSTGSPQAQKAAEDIRSLGGKVTALEEKEKQRVTRSKNIAAIFGAIGGTVLSFIVHFVSSWLTGKK